MREILFRGKRLDIGTWVHGDYTRHAFTGNPCICNEFSWNEVDPATVGQYTGLTDKHGKRIFEGDIIISGYTVAKVVFEKCQWREVDRLGYWSELFDDDVEIIGNIHDNPELLKGGEG